ADRPDVRRASGHGGPTPRPGQPRGPPPPWRWRETCSRWKLPEDGMSRLKQAWLMVPCALAGLASCGRGGSTTTASGPLCVDDPGPAPMRRLTRFEYGRSLADLTGVDPSVARKLPPDEETM